jgi:hypothetical protein
MDILKIQPDDDFNMIMEVYKNLQFKRGYCIAINLKDEFVLIETKRVDIENPTLEQIENSKTISISWTSKYALGAREYKLHGNIPIEPKQIKRFWSVAGRSYDDFLEGKDVEIYIKEVEGDYHVNLVGTTHDVNIIKELYHYNGTNTYATIMLDYLLRYNRDENNINTLKW